MKGVSLPINTIVIVIIAITVLIALLTVFVTSLFPNTLRMKKAQKLSEMCILARMRGCDSSLGTSMQTTIEGRSYTLVDLCTQIKYTNDIRQCCCPTETTQTS